MSVFPLPRIIVRAGSGRERYAITQSAKPTQNPRPEIPIPQGDRALRNVACCVVGNAVMMLGTQRAVLVPFRKGDGPLGPLLVPFRFSVFCVNFHSVSNHFHHSWVGRGLLSYGLLSVRDLDPPVPLLIGHKIIATMNPIWNNLTDEFGILIDEQDKILQKRGSG